MKTKPFKKFMCVLLASLTPGGGGSSVAFAKAGSVPSDLRDAPAAAPATAFRPLAADVFLSPKPETWGSWVSINSEGPVCGRGQTANCRWGDCGFKGKLERPGAKVPILCWITASYRTNKDNPKIKEYTSLVSPFDLTMRDGKLTAVRLHRGKLQSVAAAFGESLSDPSTRVLVSIKPQYASIPEPSTPPPAPRPPHRPPAPRPGPKPPVPAPKPPVPQKPGKSLDGQFSDQEKVLLRIALGDGAAATTPNQWADEYDKDNKAAEASEDASAKLLKKWQDRLRETATKYVVSPEADAKPSPTKDRLTAFETTYLYYHPQIQKLDVTAVLDRLMQEADDRAKKGDPKPGDLLITGIRKLMRQDVKAYADTGKTPVPEALVEWAKKYLTKDATLDSATRPFAPSAPPAPAPTSAVDKAIQQLFADPVEQALVGFLLQSAPNRTDVEKALIDAASKSADDPARAVIINQSRTEIKKYLNDLLYKKADLRNKNWLEAADSALSRWLSDRNLTQDRLLVYYCSTLWVANGGGAAAAGAPRSGAGSTPQANAQTAAAPASSSTAQSASPAGAAQKPGADGKAAAPRGPDGKGSAAQAPDGEGTPAPDAAAQARQQQIDLAAVQSIQAAGASNLASVQNARNKVLGLQDRLNADLIAGGSTAEGQTAANAMIFDSAAANAVDERCRGIAAPPSTPPGGGPIQTTPPPAGPPTQVDVPPTTPDVSTPPPKKPDHTNMFRNIAGGAIGALGYALFGFAAFGPIGALIGAIVGAVLGAVEIQLNNNPIGG